MGENGPERPNISINPVDAAIRERASRQHGHVTRAQVLQMGLGDSGIKGRVHNGSFVPRYPGVYAIAPVRDDPAAVAAAAVLACGPHAVLSHHSAAYLWGFVRYWEPPPHVTLTHGDRRPRHILTHRCPALKRRDVTRQHDVPITSPARTTLDLAPTLTPTQLTRTVNDARRSGYLHLSSLGDVVARNRHHPGATQLKAFVEQPANPTRSPFEDDFKLFTAKYGLPTPLINTKVNGYEVDAYFPDHDLIVELDSREFHSDAEAFETDRERDAEQLKHGLGTVRITTTRLAKTPGYEAERLRETLDRRRADH